MHALVSMNHKCHTYSMVSKVQRKRQNYIVGNQSSYIRGHNTKGERKPDMSADGSKGITVVCIEQNRLARAARCCAELV